MPRRYQFQFRHSPLHIACPPPTPPQRTPPGYTLYANSNCYSGHGGVDIDSTPVQPQTAAQCTARCDADAQCDCVTCAPGSRVCPVQNPDCFAKVGPAARGMNAELHDTTLYKPRGAVQLVRAVRFNPSAWNEMARVAAAVPRHHPGPRLAPGITLALPREIAARYP